MRDAGTDARADRNTGTDRCPECNAAAQARSRQSQANSLANTDCKSDPEPHTNAGTDSAADLRTGRHEDRDSSCGMHPRTDTVSDAECSAVAASDTADDRLTKRGGLRIAARNVTAITIGSTHDTRAGTDKIGAAPTMKN